MDPEKLLNHLYDLENQYYDLYENSDYKNLINFIKKNRLKFPALLKIGLKLLAPAIHDNDLVAIVILWYFEIESFESVDIDINANPETIKLVQLAKQIAHLPLPEPSGSSLYNAILNSNPYILIYNLFNNIDPNFITPNGDTPLILAVKNKQLLSVKLLVLFDANVNLLNRDGKAAILFVDDTSIGHFLIANGADPKAGLADDLKVITQQFFDNLFGIDDLINVLKTLTLEESLDYLRYVKDLKPPVTIQAKNSLCLAIKKYLVSIGHTPIKNDSKCFDSQDTLVCNELVKPSELLGSGAFGNVKRVGSIAIKSSQIAGNIIDTSVGMSLNYESMIKVYDVINGYRCAFQLPDIQSIIMPAAKNNLYKYNFVQKKHLNPDKLLSILLACEFLWRYDILYTDLKSENILVTDDDNLVLGDLGGCVYMKRQSSFIGVSQYTPGYFIENVKIRETVCPFNTLYSLALIYSEMTFKNVVEVWDHVQKIDNLFSVQRAFLRFVITSGKSIDEIGFPKLCNDIYNTTWSDDITGYNEQKRDYKQYRFSDYIPEDILGSSELYFPIGRNAFNTNVACGPRKVSIKTQLPILYNLLKLESLSVSMAVLHNVHYLNTKTVMTNNDIKTLVTLVSYVIERHLVGFGSEFEKLITMLNGIIIPVNYSDFFKQSDLDDKCMAFLDDDYLTVFEDYISDNKFKKFKGVPKVDIKFIGELENFMKAFSKSK